MKLTNYLRDAFIRAAMQDVPQVAYSDQMEKLIRDDAIAQLPPKVRAIYKDSSLRPYVNAEYAYNYGGHSVPTVAGERFAPTEKTQQEYKALAAAEKAQADHRHELQQKLRACAYACSTRDALVKMLPEFEKYMPASEEKAIRSLPVVANVVSDFVEAGWPAGRGKAKAAA